MNIKKKMKNSNSVHDPRLCFLRGFLPVVLHWAMDVIWVSDDGRGNTVGKQGERKGKKREVSPGREKISSAWNAEFIGVLPSLVSQRYELVQLLSSPSERWEKP